MRRREIVSVGPTRGRPTVYAFLQSSQTLSLLGGVAEEVRRRRDARDQDEEGAGGGNGEKRGADKKRAGTHGGEGENSGGACAAGANKQQRSPRGVPSGPDAHDKSVTRASVCGSAMGH
eukprot:986974-Prorocentrum_minimum.AAC.1